MATLREVAALAQVSTATVSKVLSNTPYVRAATRARVLEAVEQLGYVPHLAARALSKGRTYIIGIIFPYNVDHLFADPLILLMLEGIETVCTEQGYNLLLSTPRIPVENSAQYQRLVRSRYFDGVIALETLDEAPISLLIDRSGYPWIAIGHRSARGTDNTVCPDDFAGARAAAEHLLSLGHRDVGIIGVAGAALAAAGQRLCGYRAAFEAHGLDFDQVPVVIGSFSIESGYTAAGELLRRSPRPTAILCLNDRMAMGAIRRAWAEGIHVPRDLSVVGFDDIPNAAYFTPPLTTVSQQAAAMGSKAARMLFERIERSGRSTAEGEYLPQVIFPTQLIIRASTAAPAASPT